MNIQDFIFKNGFLLLHRKYGLAKGSLSRWKKGQGRITQIIKLGFYAIDQIEKGNIEMPEFIQENKDNI